jgi:uncharacterized protein (DUF433 family)
MATDRDVTVPDPEHPRIVADDLFNGEPRVSGRRISVLNVYERVRDGDGAMAPEEFAETFRIEVTDVYHALAYYYAHREEMARHREARTRESEELHERITRDRPAGIDPTPGANE